MNFHITSALCFCIGICLPAIAGAYESKYAGEQHREIKSLSADDIQELRKGGGWGLAKAAELNGVPGPAHILEMQEKIHLSAEQKAQIQALYQHMKKEAVDLGEQLIALETTLNTHFSDNTITEALLETTVRDIENVRAKLRIAHLSTHLKTPDILTPEQISLYNKLRGYNTKSACDNVPEGHNAKMWKKHHGCQ